MNAFPIRHRLPVLLGSLVILLLAIIPLTQVKINSDLESYMPETMQSKQNNRHIAEHFSTAENLLVVVDAMPVKSDEASFVPDILQTRNLKTLQQMSDEFLQLPEISRVHSLFQTTRIENRDGNMLIESAIPQLPENDEERETLRKSLIKNELANGLVISDDFRYAMLMLEVKRDTTNPNADAVLLDQVRKVITTQHTRFDGNIYVTGQAYLRDDANRKIGRDILILLPIGLLVMLAFLWFSFRELKLILLPFSIVVVSIIVAMALIPAFGWKLSLIGVLIPIMMIAIANNYGVHVIARFQELNSVDDLNPEASTENSRETHHKQLSQTIHYLRKPVWLCGLTTIAGTLGLTAHLLIPARQMGIISSLGIAFALIMSLLYLPAAMSYFTIKKQPPHTKYPTRIKNPIASKLNFLPIILEKTSHNLIRYPRRPLIIASLILLFCIAGLTMLKVAPDSSNILPVNHEFNKAIRIADSNFGGSKLLQVMIEGDAREPALLKAIDSVSTCVGKNPLVGRVASLATMIRKMHEASASESGSNKEMDKLRPVAAAENLLPDTREAISQYLELYGMSADIADYERFINFNYSHTLITIQYRSANLKEVNSLIMDIEASLQQHNLSYTIGGTSLIDKEISESVRTGQFSSLAVALLAILILLGLIFRSLKAGLIGSIPLIISVICTFGIMGWTGIRLDIVTALLSSISIGLGVDFTIHIFWRMKHELTLNGGNWNAAVISTLTGTGRGITINAVSVITGFSVLLLSSFPFVQSFGLLIILSLLLCLASALLIIPVLCLLLKPRFLTINS